MIGKTQMIHIFNMFDLLNFIKQCISEFPNKFRLYVKLLNISQSYCDIYTLMCLEH